MANKEALRELQSRLAERMQQARSRSDAVQSWLAVEVRGVGVLLPLEQAGEIHAWIQPTPVPHTHPWFRGVTNLRGGLYGVVDLGEYLGLTRNTDVQPTRDQARLVALNPQFGVNGALYVDRLAGLKRADQMRPAREADEGGSDPGTEPSERPAFAGDRWADADGRVWQELRLAELAQDEEFLAVAA